MSGAGSKKPLNSDGWLAALASSALGSGGGVRLAHFVSFAITNQSQKENIGKKSLFSRNRIILLVRVLCTVRSVQPILYPTRMKTKAGFPFFLCVYFGNLVYFGQGEGLTAETLGLVLAV